MNYNNISKEIQRKKKKNIPDVPQDLEALGDLLYDYKVYKNILQGMVQTNNDETALIFSNNVLLQELNKTEANFLHRNYLVKIYYNFMK